MSTNNSSRRFPARSDVGREFLTSFKSRDDILTLLVHLGYLTYDRESQTVGIPNEEVKMEFVNAVEDAGWDSVMNAIQASDRLLEATWRMDENAVAAGILAVHTANTSEGR